MNKPLTTLVAALLIGVSGQALAHGGDHHHGHHHGHHGHHVGYEPERYYDHRPAYGKVIAVRPIVRVVTVSTPRESCRSEEVVRHRRHGDSVVPTVVGGMVGGMIGHEIGSRHNKDVTTVAGAVLGAAIGNDMGRHHGDRVITTREQCRVVEDRHQEEQIEGYWVTYRYKGEKYTTRMDHDPGDTVRVQVASR